ncbi:hypothetical protein [Shewanella sp. GD03713]|uniref:hypothetical protein n=1 Tax=Shewanella sp. GD03713 TaxID=2975372 RepID=UPI0024487725|nr:hypothetical protein [Shewanella sp. GD03713]MDH1472769.1 hypothetical protein [Shewanella sp. GD03713]
MVKLKSSFDVRHLSDTLILLTDNDAGGRSVTNDADAVIEWLELNIGIGRRRVYYRDSMERFDELQVQDGRFKDFKACTESQQQFLAQICERGNLSAIETYCEEDRVLLAGMEPCELQIFTAWYLVLNLLNGQECRMYYNVALLERMTGVSCWYQYFSMGFTPQQALDADFQKALS